MSKTVDLDIEELNQMHEDLMVAMGELMSGDTEAAKDTLSEVISFVEWRIAP